MQIMYIIKACFTSRKTIQLQVGMMLKIYVCLIRNYILLMQHWYIHVHVIKCETNVYICDQVAVQSTLPKSNSHFE